MATVHVASTLADLQADLTTLPKRHATGLASTVKRSVTEAEKLMQGIAKGAAGRHGSNYFKRISSEMLGPFEGEAGPHGVVQGNAVGAGWRNGGPNTDTEKTADVMGPRFERAVGKHLDGLFW